MLESNEILISLADAATLIPGRRPGRPIHTSTLVRWITRGVRGRRLEAIRAGSRWCTTREAMARFLRGDDPVSTPSSTPVIEQALQQLGL